MNFQAFRLSVIHYGQEQLEILTNGFTDQLGHGGSGRVYKGKALDSEMAIAIKCLNEGERYIKMWKTELTLLNKFQHKNIINLVGYCPAYPSLAIMTEFMEKGDLRQHIDSDINWLLRVQIAYAVAKALREVHAEGVTLHHFKTSNVLIDEDYTPKIGDFGIAVSEEIPVHWQLPGFGTYGYIDPKQCEVAEVEIPVYSYAELKMFTNGFSAENFMGKTFSSNSLLYRGEIVDKESNLVRKVIVDLPKDKKDYYLRENEKDYDLKAWQTQLNALKDPTISGHPNVVKLQGYCNSAGNLGLVYDCHALGTLHSLIFDESFSWSMRMKVALQLARVLQFLHSQEKPLILLNFEPRSILVDMDFNPLIFGFAMASGGGLGIFDHTVLKLIFLSSPQVYIDPEYSLCGMPCVYSFSCR
ncbi:putative serine/threonine-protein kinase PBL28 [Cocos nucifera]|uniref:Putative serine/threonine-protein kinase PBL28 n=1 Tax=Cocos nucifera TaxID=13894 RepID=A0A8K0MUD8_COCNU|nr:putative serine/threonine-protein kinase PBL28 [Cocos nucifera]